MGFLFGCFLMVFIGSVPTIVLEPIVSSIYFLINGVWSSPINEFIVETYTFKFETPLLGLNIILNEIWAMQSETWGRIKLTGIMIVPTLISMAGLVFIESKASADGILSNFPEDNWGFLIAGAFGLILIAPGWSGGIFWLLFKVLKLLF
jgi:hypothetical protein